MNTREIKSREFYLRAIVVAIALRVTLWATPALGDASQDVPFNFGESCEQLFDLVDDELRTLTSATYADNFARMCVPEWPNTCDDYSAVVAQFGDLKASPNDYFCHFSAKN